MLRVVRAVKIAVHVALLFVAFITAYEVRLDLPPAWWITAPLARAVVTWGLLYAAMAGVVEMIFRTDDHPGAMPRLGRCSAWRSPA